MERTYLKPMENNKYKTIKKLSENLKNANYCECQRLKNRAAVKLGLSRRQINNLLNIYRTKGIKGFVHGNRGRLPAKTLSYDTVEMIVNLYNDKYFDFNFNHFTECLNKIEKIKVSYSCVYNILTSRGLYSKRIHRSTKKKIKRRVKTLEKNISSTTDYINQQVDLKLEVVDPHPRRERKKNAGELLQIDASKHIWFGNEYCHLHAAIDDSTGQIVGAYFAKEETLSGYYHMTKQIFQNYGVPLAILTDNRTVFEYGKLSNPTLDKDTKTQYGFMCLGLGIELRTTSVPQAKGRIERLFNTLQDRLVSEMRLLCISTIKEANIFLLEFLPEFNKRFASQLNNNRNVFTNQLSEQQINRHLSIISKRKIDKGHCIKYQNEYYFPINSHGNDVYFTKGTEVLIIKTFDHLLLMNVMDKLYRLRLVERNERFSKEFDIVPKKEKKVYKPPMNHPWRQASFNEYIAKQKHLNIGAL